MRQLLLALLLINNALAGDLGIFQAPPGPSTDINVFKRQLLFHNVNIIIDKAKKANKEVNLVVNVTNQVRDGGVAIPKYRDEITGAELNSGVNLQKGTAFSSIKYDKNAVTYRTDLISNKHDIILNRGIYSINYNRPFKQKLYNLNLAVSTGW